MNGISQNRIIGANVTGLDIIFALSGGDSDAVRVLGYWLTSGPMGVVEMLTLDSKRLYDDRIVELFERCGEDLERFKYHVQVELPNQETGKLTVTGPLAPDFDDKEFWAKRSFGKPGSFWALEFPPMDPYYEYPIK